MTAARVGLLLALVLCTPSLVHGDLGQSSSREFPLPLPEMEHIISRWFSQSGLQVSRTLPEPGRVDLNARREGESWEVALKTRSPLATEISASCILNGQPDEARRDGLWVYLAQYLRDLSTAEEKACEEAPEAVVSKRRAVVCIKAAVEGGDLQFSGFLIDRKGLALATAHDLQGAYEITVTLSDGRTFKGGGLDVPPVGRTDAGEAGDDRTASRLPPPVARGQAAGGNAVRGRGGGGQTLEHPHRLAGCGRPTRHARPADRMAFSG